MAVVVVKKAYLDNNLVSAITKLDLEASEMAAFERLRARRTGGETMLVTSQETTREQERARDSSFGRGQARDYKSSRRCSNGRELSEPAG